MGPGYEPTSAGNELEAEATAYVLGGASSTGSSANLTASERRAQVLEATLRRLKAEEKQIEDMCGSAGNQGHS